MFDDTVAELYDSLLSLFGKNYYQEVEFIEQKISEKTHDSKRGNLLDVGCGSGSHIVNFMKYYKRLHGFDFSESMIQKAKNKSKNIDFSCQNMQSFSYNIKFDIITCLFGSISYLSNEKEVEKTIENIYLHNKTNGIFVLEPWYTSEEIKKCNSQSFFGSYGNISGCRIYNIESDNEYGVLSDYILYKRGNLIIQKEAKHRILLLNYDFYISKMELFGYIVEKIDNPNTGRCILIGILR
jgi:dTDP-3-amino-3,6-dideoxy-alpha-D-glucopyranose N,N-dimethyltransferase